MSTRRYFLAPLGLLTLTGSAAMGTNVVITPLFLEGDTAAGTGAAFQTFDRPNLTSGGKAFFAGDTNGPTGADDVVYFDGTLIAQEGMAAPNALGVFSSFEFFETSRQTTASGLGAFIATLTGGSSTANRAIYAGTSSNALTLIALEGEPAPGAAGDLFVDFGFVGVLDDGSVSFLADLDSLTEMDSVIYSQGAILFREGDPVPLSLGLPGGTTWDADFDEMQWNGAGDLIFEGTTSVPADDMVVVRYLAGSGASQLVAREGQAVAANTGPDELELILQTSLAENGRWALRGNLGIAPSNQDAVIITDDARVFQEGEDVPELGAGVVTGNFNAVNMNSQGDVVYLADISGASDPNIDEGVFLNGKLLVTDGVQVPGLPAGTFFSDIGFEDVYINDAGQILFASDYSGVVTGDGLFLMTVATPPACPGDISGPGGMPDGQVDIDDLNALLSAFGTSVGVGDPRDVANNDGFVDIDDLNVVLSAFGSACP